MQNHQVYIEAPARLHFGFLDLDGALGRRFGSLGLTISDVATRLLVREAEQVNVVGESSGRVKKYLTNFLSRKGLATSYEIEIKSKIPDHSGLGSGTQLALAVGAAIAKLSDLDCELTDIATLLNRGARSGIGIGAFQKGGFLVDAGRDTESKVPPIVSRLEFPLNWRVLLVLDESIQGVHGQDEITSFSSLPPFSSDTAARLCRYVLMQILPAIYEKNIELFNLGIYELQRSMGEYFASAQGGRYTSKLVGNVISYLESLGVKGVGQSSWGPTGFAFFDSETQAHTLMRELQAKFADNPELKYKIVSGRNNGALIEKKDLVPLSKVNRS